VDLTALARELGFSEPKKSATNLRLLHSVLTDAPLLARIILTAGDAASPDHALNSLERLSDILPAGELKPVLEDGISRRRLLTILGASPFLTGILCRKPSYFQDLFPGGEIERRKDEAEMEAELRERVPGDADFGVLQRELRLYKFREILRIAGRDLCGLAGLAEVTGELSALAAASLQRSYEICDTLLRREYGAPILAGGADQPAAEAEFTIFGMGKLGGRELNFSSDIDLIYFYSSEKGMTAGVPGPLGETRNRLHLHQYFCKLGEMITRAVGQATEDGFVFRVDLRLRPEGNGGEMANSLRSA
jgi:glutamate-ammonia-ligase adenylyltransferase